MGWVSDARPSVPTLLPGTVVRDYIIVASFPTALSGLNEYQAKAVNSDQRFRLYETAVAHDLDTQEADQRLRTVQCLFTERFVHGDHLYLACEWPAALRRFDRPEPGDTPWHEVLVRALEAMHRLHTLGFPACYVAPESVWADHSQHRVALSFACGAPPDEAGVGRERSDRDGPARLAGGLRNLISRLASAAGARDQAQGALDLVDAWIQASDTRSSPQRLILELRWALLAHPLPITWEIGACTDGGLTRLHNEDSVYAQHVETHEGNAAAQTLLGIMADGMGGARAGQLASRLAVETIAERAGRHLREARQGVAELAEVLREAALGANRAINEMAASSPELQGMGTTCTAVAVSGLTGAVVHVGDTRLYVLEPEGDLHQVTEDDTVAAHLVRMGRSAPAEAKTSRRKHMLTDCLGAGGEGSPKTSRLTLRPGQRLAILSDGVHGCLSDDELRSVLQRAASAAEASRELVLRAMAAGSQDNASAVVLASRA